MGYSPEEVEVGARLFGGDEALAVLFLTQLQDLVAMGFARERAQAALLEAQSADGAVQLLLERSSSPATGAAAGAHPAFAPASASPSQLGSQAPQPATPPTPQTPQSMSVVACPSCSAHLRVATVIDAAASAVFQCPSCSARFRVQSDAVE